MASGNHNATERDELEQIMSEIEDLRKEMIEPSSTETESSEPDMLSNERDIAPVPSTGVEEDHESNMRSFEKEMDDIISGGSELFDREKKHEAIATVSPLHERPAESDDLADFRGSKDDFSMEETLANLEEEEPEEGSLLSSSMSEDKKENAVEHDSGDSRSGRMMDAQVTSISSSDERERLEDNGNGISMSVRGNMNVQLWFEDIGQEVVISANERRLVIRFDDGTEFKVPVKAKTRVA